MINWKAISEKYPKAWFQFLPWANELMSDFCNPESGIELLDKPDRDGNQLISPSGYECQAVPFPTRFLYDFFDAEGIYVQVVYAGEKDWVWGINLRDKPVFEVTARDEVSYPSRAEAETIAFTKAFEILEERLNK